MSSNSNMNSIIRLVRDEALKTFNGFSKGTNKIPDKLPQLLSLVKRLQWKDVGLDRDLLSKVRKDLTVRNAPVTYVGIEERENFIINMFILRAGSNLPLHDHPCMWGILKVIYGKIKIQCYSLVDGEYSTVHSENIKVMKEPDKIIDESADPVVLNPVKGNIHTIESVNGPAAFVDILAPPYRTELDDHGERACNYYIDNDLVEDGFKVLLKVNSAGNFWTDTAPYLGPSLS